MITRVSGKGRTTPLGAAEFTALRAAYATTAVDVGTGDGRYAYAVASARPDVFVLGLDALDEPMGEIAAKAARKPGKGGRPNLVLIRASIEALPAELTGIADEISVNLPWGHLLEGIVLGSDDVVGGLAALGHAGTRLSVTLNGEVWLDSTPVRYESLPVPTAAHVADVIAPACARAGIRIGPARTMTAEETKKLPTTWARKLGHSRARPTFVYFEGVVET